MPGSAGRDVEPHCCVPRWSLSSRALVSLTRRPAAIVWIFSCFFSFSPANMCFQYPSEPGLWGPLLLSPVLVFSLQPDSLAGAVPTVTSCHLRGKPRWEGEADGKFCFSESSRRHWGSFLLSEKSKLCFAPSWTGFPQQCPQTQRVSWPPLLQGGAAVTVLEQRIQCGSLVLGLSHTAGCRFAPWMRQQVPGSLAALRSLLWYLCLLQEVTGRVAVLVEL